MTADIKPVAWVSNRDPMFGDGWGATSPIVYSDPGAHAAPSGELVPLYPQSAIDSLQVMLDDAHADFKEMERLAHMHKARAERAEAEVEALRADVEAWKASHTMLTDTCHHFQARAERLAEAGRRVTAAFRALGETTAWTRAAEQARHECEAAMLALDDALRDHDQEGGNP